MPPPTASFVPGNVSTCSEGDQTSYRYVAYAGTESLTGIEVRTL